jgi:pimeloyl-ACP methyl ester carboxylesterase
MEQTILPDPRPLLASITAPTLLLWGDKDAFIPITNAQDYLAALPNARLVTLRNIGHLPQEEAPAESLTPLRAFLDGS